MSLFFTSSRLSIKALWLTSISSILFSCTNYQYISLSSELDKTSRHEYVYEIDSAKIKYTFNGINCPVTFQITNLSSLPLFIDWAKSSAIVNGANLSYFQNKSTINFSSSGVGIQWTEDLSTQHSSTNGSVIRDKAISFVAPKSSITVTRAHIKKGHLAIRHSSSMKNIRVPVQGKMRRMKRYNFDQQDSPLSFRSYLTFSRDATMQNSTSVDHFFWVDGIVETPFHPDEYQYQPPNQFYVINRQ